jgi:hypothetical protein
VARSLGDLNQIRQTGSDGQQKLNDYAISVKRPVVNRGQRTLVLFQLTGDNTHNFVLNTMVFSFILMMWAVRQWLD